MSAEDMTERARELIEQDQVQLLTDYEVHPDAWKGDPDRCDAVAALADAILEPAAAEITRLRAAIDAARAKALEDAAKVAHAELHFDGELATEVAAAIRAMIEQEDKG